MYKAVGAGYLCVPYRHFNDFNSPYHPYNCKYQLYCHVLQEIRVLRDLKHPNIVQYYGSEIVSAPLLPVIMYRFKISSRLMTQGEHFAVLRLMIIFTYIWSILILVRSISMSVNTVDT